MNNQEKRNFKYSKSIINSDDHCKNNLSEGSLKLPELNSPKSLDVNDKNCKFKKMNKVETLKEKENKDF